VERSVPSIAEGSSPVTRLITFSTLSGPVKVAVSRAPIPKRKKLWKRFPPCRSPSSGVIR
jgi:hypothetical protein